MAAARTLTRAPGRALRRADRDAVRRPARACSRQPRAHRRSRSARRSARSASCASASARCRRWRARCASRAHRAAPRRAARGHARRAARAARHRRMDGAADRDARAGLARRVSRHRHRRAERARHARHEGRGRAGRSLAALARLRRDAAVANTGDEHDDDCTRLRSPQIATLRQAFDGVPLAAQAVIDSPIGPLTRWPPRAASPGCGSTARRTTPARSTRRSIQAMRTSRRCGAGSTPTGPAASRRRDSCRWTCTARRSSAPCGARCCRSRLGRHTQLWRRSRSRCGSPRRCARAGAAIGRNPVSILVPCHRVIGADGSLTGYAGGLPRKQRAAAARRRAAG